MNNCIYQFKQAWAGLSAKRRFLLTVVTTIGFSDALARYINLQLVALFAATSGLISIMAIFAYYWRLRPFINYPRFAPCA